MGQTEIQWAFLESQGTMGIGDNTLALQPQNRIERERGPHGSSLNTCMYPVIPGLPAFDSEGVPM